MKNYKILSRIDDYRALKNLSEDEINTLIDEIRDYIIDVTSKNGGHIGPSLGVVELTVAILKVFDPEIDRIVWDIGHQAYSWKILTGRKEQFRTLRQYRGISGFLKRKESRYDHFGAGHSSTSISASLGMRKAKDLLRKEGWTVAIIGDGAMTAGQAFEGLNHAGWLDPEKFIVILNDNQMSISPNVGALYTYFNRIITNEVFQKSRQKLKDIIKKVFGESGAKIARKFEEYVKGLFAPGIIFEELGFTYVGTIDGHNLLELEKTLENVKKMRGPVIVHVLTQKGRGYAPAEQNPTPFHGISPFDKITGTPLKKVGTPPSWSKVFGDALVELAEKDEKIVAITPAMKEGSGLTKFADRFPERFFDVGIAEQHAATFAAGFSVEGMKPVLSYYSTFLQRGYDQVIHDIALQHLPVVIAIDRAGLVGEDGPTHHGVYDIAFLRAIPDIVISAPKDQQELRNLLYTGLKSGKVFAIRYPRGSAIGDKADGFEEIEIGSWEIIDEGKDISILAVGKYVSRAIEVKKLLKKYGFNPTIVNARFIKPMDEELLKEILKTHKYIVTMEDGALNGGFGSAVAEYILDNRYMNELLRFGIPDRFVQHGKINQLEEELGLLPEQMVEKIKDFVRLEDYKVVG
ncbi:1-deoxy-D-xylulose-5-phosphate synthase [Persephonella hydrogeniphila]|uniref:1-deoxy-D-xylulose-5-phosphate synthase n=1 Tax=Persephonella hydrogeniphila TaxID=198703 RepID=A0A285NKZ3_9AQUI|nr:1-deoxy-D-xylulose-5-phosphate synthase [Persephonella hydrogeniphila]SNZ09898.1 1-deoxy-D-xylulose-5-phosphate synthase [Persephonella hydrogeniphila]